MDVTENQSKPKVAKKSRVHNKNKDAAAKNQSKTKTKNKPEKTIDNLTQLVEVLVAAYDKSESQQKLIAAPSNLQAFGKSLIEALYDSKTKINKSFKINKLSLEMIYILSNRIINPFYIIYIATNQNVPLESRSLYQKKLLQFEFLEDHYAFMMEKLKESVDNHQKVSIYLEIISTGIFSKNGGHNQLWKFIPQILGCGLSIEQKISLSDNLLESKDFFYSLDSKNQVKICQKIWESDIQFFWILLLNMSQASVSVIDVEKIITSKRLESLIEFCTLRKIPNLIQNERVVLKLITPIFRSYLGSVMKFSQILELYPFLEIVIELCGIELVKSSINRCYGEEDEISQLLSNTQNSDLNEEFDLMKKRFEFISNENSSNIERIKAYEVRLQEFERVLASTEDQLRQSVNIANANQNALLEQKIVATLKRVVEIFDEAFEVSDNESARIALEKLGITQLGHRGMKMNWDSEICQTMTGETIAIGLVVSSGYLWQDSGKKVLLKRVILKPG